MCYGYCCTSDGGGGDVNCETDVMPCVQANRATLISGAAGNQLSDDGTGLFVPAAAGGAITTADTVTVDLTGDGSTGTPLTADARVSATAGNQLSTQSDGLFVAAASPATVTTADTTTVDLSGDGSAAAPLTAAAVVSPAAGNQLSDNGTGLFVPAAPAPTVTTADSDTAALTGNGSAAVPLTAAVRLDPAAANLATESSAGVMVPTRTGNVVDMIVGIVEVQADEANVVKAVTVTFPRPLVAAATYSIQLTDLSTRPDLFSATSFAGLTATGVILYIHRSTLTAWNVHYMALAFS